MRQRLFRALRAFVAILSLGVWLARAEPAEASSTRLNLGAAYWFNEQGVFDASLSLLAPVASVLSAGGRFGVLVASAEPTLGVPVDLLLRIRLASPIYAEITGGPWFLFRSGRKIAAHFGVGLGFESGSVSFGPEVSYLEPDAMIGARLSFRL